MKTFGKVGAGMVVALAVASSLALGSGGAGAEVGAENETIHVVERIVRFDYFDPDEDGASIGDTTALYGRLLDEDGVRVGSDGQHCVVIRDDGLFHCTLTLRLTGGQVAAQGLAVAGSVPYTVKFAVTGGTGAFADVGGQIRLEQVTEESSNLTIDLIHLAA